MEVNVKDKKGMGHIEVIMSFVIFVAFLIFMFFMFKPLKISSPGYLDITESKIMDYVSVDLSVFSVKVSSDFAGECASFDYQVGHPIIAKNHGGDIVLAENAGRIYLDTSGTSRFFKIYSAKGLEEKAPIGSCVELEEGEYTLGVKRTFKKIHSKELANLERNYKEDYEQVKRELGLVNDFNFFVSNEEGIIFRGERRKPKNTEIIAKTIPIEILDEDANLNPAIMYIQTWQ